MRLDRIYKTKKYKASFCLWIINKKFLMLFYNFYTFTTTKKEIYDVSNNFYNNLCYRVLKKY